MNVTLDLFQLKQMCRDMAALGAAQWQKMNAPEKDFCSQREAYGKFGEERVKRWLKQSLITPHRTGVAKNSKKLFSKAELLAVYNAEQQQSYVYSQTKNEP